MSIHNLNLLIKSSKTPSNSSRICFTPNFLIENLNCGRVRNMINCYSKWLLTQESQLIQLLSNWSTSLILWENKCNCSQLNTKLSIISISKYRIFIISNFNPQSKVRLKILIYIIEIIHFILFKTIIINNFPKP
jgi:hypothetical protein